MTRADRSIWAEPLSASEFAPFGDVIAASDVPDKVINQGNCGRWHDRAILDFGDGRPGLSLFEAGPRSLPYCLDMVERHPRGSQAFLPMTEHPFLIIVAPDTLTGPGRPRAFLSNGAQGVNYHRGVWHGVLTPLHAPGRFAVVDRIGDGDNLEEHWFEEPYGVRQRG
ncbi:MAG: ureidoglycolate lyase [Pseudomonadota bacterium]